MDRASALGEGQPGAMLRTLSSRRVAGLIRALDSRLLGISYDDSGPEPVLIYTFELAGAVQQFAVAARPEALFSIADLYIEAAAYERELERRYAIVFQAPGRARE